MQVRVCPGQAGAAQAAAEGRVVVIVDALRASSTLATLFHCGAAEVLVVAEVEQARAWRQAHPEVLCAGERGGKRLADFDLGNSPLAILEADVRQRKVVFTSSNAAACFAAAAGAPAVLTGALVNASALVAALVDEPLAEQRGAALIPAGKHQDPQFVTIEDWLSCGHLLRLLEARGAQLAGGEAQRALDLAGNLPAGGYAQAFAEGAHGQHLARIGYAADIPFCARTDRLSVVPCRAAVVALPDGQQAALLRPEHRPPASPQEETEDA